MHAFIGETIIFQRISATAHRKHLKKVKQKSVLNSYLYQIIVKDIFARSCLSQMHTMVNCNINMLGTLD